MKVSIRKHSVKNCFCPQQGSHSSIGRTTRIDEVIPPSTYATHQPFQYLLTVAETHDGSQQPTDFNILLPFIAMWKLYGVVLNEAGAMIGRRPLPKLSFNLLGHLQAFVFSSEMQRYCKSNAKLSCLHEKVVPGYSLSYLKILHL